jgi:hypothetical protein
MANFENQHWLQHLWALLAPYFVRHSNGMRPSAVFIFLLHIQQLTLSELPPLDKGDLLVRRFLIERFLIERFLIDFFII